MYTGNLEFHCKRRHSNIHVVKVASPSDFFRASEVAVKLSLCEHGMIVKVRWAGGRLRQDVRCSVSHVTSSKVLRFRAKAKLKGLIRDQK